MLVREEEKYIIKPDYEITFRTLKEHDLNNINTVDKDKFIKLMDLTKKDPKSAINDLISFNKKYPNLYISYNYLYNAYVMTNQKEKSYQIAEEAYKKFPNNIYAKITYAYKFLENNDFKKVSEIFNNKFDLKELYPEKKMFHISELVGLTDFAVTYYLKTNQKEKAEEIFLQLKRIAPSHRLIIILTRRIDSYN